MVDFPREVWIRKCISCKLITIIITERGGVCCSRNLNNLTACLRVYSSIKMKNANNIYVVADFCYFFFLFYISVRRISGGGMVVWQEILVNRWLFWIPNFQKLRQLRTSQGRKKKFKVSFVSREASRRPKWTTNCEYNSKFKKLSTQL